jgi:hypothetical protein
MTTKAKTKSASSARASRQGTSAAGTKKAKARRPIEPSKASLKAIPEIDFRTAKLRRNPYAARIAAEGLVVQVGRGRPKKLLEVGKTHPRSVRFPDAVWARVEVRAKEKGITLHAALREAILAWLRHAAA